jgi:hypothetical protein
MRPPHKPHVNPIKGPFCAPRAPHSVAWGLIPGLDPLVCLALAEPPTAPIQGFAHGPIPGLGLGLDPKGPGSLDTP